ncbi:MAG: MBL fold metallo-hydrolase, partial [Candidatus Dormibacteraeota bacterium]|nr:MBL fold metallo-hydrolase [Candidatus Dormibacteraeota bacterium]
WILGGDPVAVVVDPGPDDDRHLDAIARSLGTAPIGLILVTHSHPDHLPLAARLGERQHSRVLRHPELSDGDVLQVGKVTLRALFTPGHASDHFCFVQEEDGAVFTGDLVLGRGSTMITYPDGDMAAYLRSLSRLIELRPRILFPGHFDPVEDPQPKLEGYLAHRLEREGQVVDALASGPATPAELTARVYGSEVSGEALLRAAEMTLQAHLKKLVDEGRVRQSGPVYSLAARPG